MPKFSSASKAQLSTCDVRLQAIAEAVIEVFDFTVLEGHRDREAQNRAYAKGLSQVRWPNGRHNALPSKAFDLAPYPVDWGNSEAARQRFCYLAGWVMSTASQLDIPLRWGGDWNNNRDTRDEGFRDLGHFELIGD